MDSTIKWHTGGGGEQGVQRREEGEWYIPGRGTNTSRATAAESSQRAGGTGWCAGEAAPGWGGEEGRMEECAGRARKDLWVSPSGVTWMLESH